MYLMPPLWHFAVKHFDKKSFTLDFMEKMDQWHSWLSNRTFCKKYRSSRDLGSCQLQKEIWSTVPISIVFFFVRNNNVQKSKTSPTLTLLVVIWYKKLQFKTNSNPHLLAFHLRNKKKKAPMSGQMQAVKTKEGWCPQIEFGRIDNC